MQITILEKEKVFKPLVISVVLETPKDLGEFIFVMNQLPNPEAKNIHDMLIEVRKNLLNNL
jgi:hypothetical protein